jgi:hypothetical protein
MLAVTIHIGPLSCGVADRVAAAEGDGSGPDGGGVAIGIGLEGDAQATTRRPATTVAATREREERIRCPPEGKVPE